MSLEAPFSDWQPLPSWFRTLAAQSERAVLLETAKADGPDDESLLFLSPYVELTASTQAELEQLLSDVDHHLKQGHYAAGYFTYECGEHFLGLVPSSRGPETNPCPLAWIGIFPAPLRFAHSTGVLTGPLLENVPRDNDCAEDATIVDTGLEIAPAEYRDAIAHIQHHLHEGHTYQVNFTDHVRGEINSSPEAVYNTLLHQQPVPFAAYVNRPEGPLLSFSPEMFLRVRNGTITVRPMKGTWPRGLDLAEDEEAANRLFVDAKNRSEHVTIVDLLRNDVGRVCRPGTVHVNELFHVERYQTLLQMTSTISGQLRDELTPTQVFRHLFPSGSITGAPKRRTMEIIREVERHARGAYTGAIGYFSPHGDACFNVAIRTMELRGSTFTLGVGGGITADSDADEEYKECQLKSSFLTRRRPHFSLIETIRCEGGEVPLLALHMRRLANSAAYFGIRYDVDDLSRKLSEATTQCGNTPHRIRLLLNESGCPNIVSTPLETPPWGGRLRLSGTPTHSWDVFLRHKTTHRGRYDTELASARAAGFDEVLFLNERGELTEGAISNVFLEFGERWLTPALHCGVLPGVQRALLIDKLNAQQAELHLGDLRDATSVLVCNALRGVRQVSSIEDTDSTIIWTEMPPAG